MFWKKGYSDSQNNINRIQKKVIETTNLFDNRLRSIESFADEMYERSNLIDKQVNKFKRMCHSLSILLVDKNIDLKLNYSNHAVCSIIYGLPRVCSDLIVDRFETSVINDYIEKTGNWNSFVEADDKLEMIIQNEMIEKHFLQVGFINNEKIILKTYTKPHIENDKFDGLTSISEIISENQFEKEQVESKLLYNKNDYKLYELY